MINDIIVGGKPLMDLEPHRRIRFALHDPGSVISRDSDGEYLGNWQARAVALVLGIDTTDNPHTAFKTVSCVELSCALCEEKFDVEGEGTFHFATRKDAVDTAKSWGWDVLPDGRVICPCDEDDHEAARGTK